MQPAICIGLPLFLALGVLETAKVAESRSADLIKDYH